MARFSAPMERRLEGLEEEYDMTPQREEEEEPGLFGSRGFIGNIRDYYQMDSWGDWWRGLFRGRGRQEERKKPEYTVYPSWGRENIRTLRDIMRETGK